MRPVVRLMLTAALFASGGALLKACSFPALQRAGVRAAIAAIAIFVLLPEARRLPTARMLWLVPAYFGATVLFVVANSLTTAANAIFLQSTAPLWIVVLGPLLLRDRPTRFDMLTLLGVGAGMALFFVAPAKAVATAPDPRLGDWFAIASGLSYALLLIGMRWLSRANPGEQSAAVAWGNALTFPVAFALMPLFGQQPIAGSARDWIVVLVLGTFQVGLAYAILVRAIAHVPAMRASLVMMIEPVLNSAVAWLVHDEQPHGLALLGGAVILGTVAAIAVLARTDRS
jgi:drug/metabolite transporter (DMT)-like permease